MPDQTKIVVVNNQFLPVGTQLTLTGKQNGIPASECVRVGYFKPDHPHSGYQHSEDGQKIWIENSYLEEITT